jgi:hypothetical protein
MSVTEGLAGPVLPRQQGQMPTPKTGAEQSSLNLSFFQAMEGLGRSGRLALQGDQEAEFEAARFQKILLQIRDILARATASSQAGQRQNNLEPQTGVNPPVPSTIPRNPTGSGAPGPR